MGYNNYIIEKRFVKKYKNIHFYSINEYRKYTKINHERRPISYS